MGRLVRLIFLMKYFFIKAVTCICLAGFAFIANAQSTQAYINKYRRLADSLGPAYGIPPAVILAVATIESSSGAGRNVKLLNNHFGIVGKNHLLKTKKIKTRYKYYPNATASFIDFCNLLSRRKYYKKLKGNLNYNLWVDAISKSGYSELPSVWKQRVTAIIKKHKLASTR